jgi:hypothetical protein
VTNLGVEKVSVYHDTLDIRQILIVFERLNASAFATRRVIERLTR